MASAQVPPIVDTVSPVTPTEVPKNNNTAAISKIEVRCENLKTVVRKDTRQAVMMTWSSNYFGSEFNNAKRCQVVSERLQQAANLNGGTFQGLELASGTVNFQPVICALQNGRKKCDRENMLFTLKPENARNPEAVIQKMMNFAATGEDSINESVRPSKKLDLNLGSWERKVFGTGKPAQNLKNRNTGF
jgi:hypothetical protein